MTKVLVTGSRTWTDEESIYHALRAAGATEIAQGGATGAEDLVCVEGRGETRALLHL